jgi:hypothetical protein
MKLNNTTVERPETRDESRKRVSLSTLDARRSTRSGVALIITLILLAVVTFMALTFLAISRRERNAVTATTDSVTAQLAADDALASAEAQIAATVLATSNSYNFGLLVSTNYINPTGFQNSGPGYASPTNVNYFYPNGNPVTGPDFLQNLANLYYLPRVPVYATNLVYRTNELQFYLDLNRNGRDDANGLVSEIGPNGGFIHPNGAEDSINQNVVSNYHAGDPEWIGVLQHPDQPYGPNNPFVARYAFIALSIGNALDLNAIHNQVLDEFGAPQGNVIFVNPSSAPGGLDTFLRNQGVGSWEINLAAFLADVNTNSWGLLVGSGPTAPPGSDTYYQYNQPNNSGNKGKAFEDACALLAYRYQNNYLSLKPARLLFPIASGIRVFPFDNIDSYSDGPLQLGPAPLDEVGVIANRDNPLRPWAGADNTNQYFDMQELFDATKTAQGVTAAALAAGNDFPDHLLNAGRNVSTYDRYTYYRLLSQMGVDSAPAQNKLNLNYVNVDASGNVVPGMETNLIPWANALQFFTNAADRMLRAYSQQWLVESPSNYLATYGRFTNLGTFANPTNIPVPFGISDIPVYVNTNFVYSPAVQRVLQLAANIYDATTNRANDPTLRVDFPSVFRPTFSVTIDPVSGYTNVYINGYEQVVSVPNGTADLQLALPVEVSDLISPNPNPPNVVGFGPGLYTNVNVYGVPWIIGAKKGFPNFNKFDLQSSFQLTRKLQVRRLSTNDTFVNNPDHYFFDQMFNLSLSNQFGVECWNSYTNGYHPNNDGMVIYVRGNLRHAALSNDETFSAEFPVYSMFGSIQIPAGNIWPGYNPVTDPFGSQLSFQIPLNTNVMVITNSMYRFNTAGNVEEPGHMGPYLTTNLSLPYEQNVTFNNNQLYPQPHWFLTSTNDLQVFMLDTSVVPNRVIDYVQLNGPNSTRDLTSEIINSYDVPAISMQAGGSQLWNTNYQNGRPIGLISQVGISMGNYTASAGSGAWNTSDPYQLANEIAGFNAFFGYTPPPPYVPGELQSIAAAQMTNAMQAAYTPTATVVQHVSWQANDPLVHYTASDLNWGLNGQSAIILDRYPANLTNNYPNGTLGALNLSYRPWGGNPQLPTEDQNPGNLTIKDPLVRQSDDWDFPTYKFPSAGWLGRVHRGTPWQTVYLKSPDVLKGIQVTGGVTNYIGTNVWSQWTGDTQLLNNQYYDAVNTAPVQDRLLFDIFSTAPNDNATRGQLSVNVGANDPNNPQAGLAAWSALLSGVIVLTNNATDPFVNLATGASKQHNSSSLLRFTWFPINPAGPGGVNSALGQIVAGINQTRTNFANPDGLVGSFEHVGDILAVPQLTALSPFLNWKDPLQQTNGISEEMYEWLPQQVMSLLRVSDSPRYVIFSYGQALKPAPGGIYNGGGAYFGMVTNYQVVAEAATRAVVRFNGTRLDIVSNDVFNATWIVVPSITNNNAVVEEFNVVPSN